jgi:formylglycine-generating enzyme required for sulfatase activity
MRNIMKRILFFFVFLMAHCPVLVHAQSNQTVNECSVYITSQPSGATIFLDNEKKGKAPLYLEHLPFGEMTLYACMEGYTTQKQVFQCRARKSQKVDFLLNKLGGYGRLYVQTSPEEAQVKIMNILMEYRDGIKLRPGKYRVQVSHQGYMTTEKITEVAANQNATLTIELEKNTGQLFVHPRPEDAEVRIMNILPPYHPGIDLKPNNYRINVSKKGYLTQEKWVKISRGDEKHVTIALKEKTQEYIEDAKSSLFVHSQPENATIRIMNIIPPYEPGMKLDSGWYRVNVSQKRYNTKEVTVYLEAGEQKEIEVKLSQKKTKAVERNLIKEEVQKKNTGQLYVKCEPHNATVTLLNIQRPFENGMELLPGKYKVSVRHDGYSTKEKWIQISANSTEEVRFQLEKERHQSKTWTEPLTTMEFVFVHEGYYLMGCGNWSENCENDEMPAHKEYVESFWIGKYEVTQDQWNTMMKHNPSHFQKQGDYPVEQVSWSNAQRFIERLNQHHAGEWTFRLPTEKEWEYAARSGGRPELYAGGNLPELVAWFQNNSNATHPVGSKSANGLGLYDMSGNVWEWCQDVYSANAYSQKNEKTLKQDIQKKDDIIERVRRGGSWAFGKKKIRTTYRGKYPQDLDMLSLGLRLVCEKKKK